MTERKQGHSKLVYDKETRTIKTVDPHPAALAATPAEPKGTWSDGGKVWEGQPDTPAVGREAVNDLFRNIVYQMTPSDQYDLAFKLAENAGYMLVREPDSPHVYGTHPIERLWREHGLPEYFLGNGGTNTKLYALYDALTAATPAAERITYCEECNANRVHYRSKIIDGIQIFECLICRAAAQPASPLRGRELLDAAQKVVMRYPYVTEKEALEIAKAVLALAQPASPLRGRDEIARAFLYETGMFDNKAEIKANPEHRLVKAAYAAADRLLSASPPEQPAPSVAARMSILNDGPPGVVGKVDPSRSGPLTRPDPVTRREETITKCLKIIGIHEFSARQGVRSAMGPKVRKQALAAEAALQAVAKDIRALAQDKRGPSTSGSPVFSGGTSDDLDIEPIEGAKP